MSIIKKSFPFVYTSVIAIGKRIEKTIQTISVTKIFSLSDKFILKSNTITVTKNITTP